MWNIKLISTAKYPLARRNFGSIFTFREKHFVRIRQVTSVCNKTCLLNVGIFVIDINKTTVDTACLVFASIFNFSLSWLLLTYVKVTDSVIPVTDRLLYAEIVLHLVSLLRVLTYVLIPVYQPSIAL
jgi:hypothetical protein